MTTYTLQGKRSALSQSNLISINGKDTLVFYTNESRMEHRHDGSMEQSYIWKTKVYKRIFPSVGIQWFPKEMPSICSTRIGNASVLMLCKGPQKWKLMFCGFLDTATSKTMRRPRSSNRRPARSHHLRRLLLFKDVE